MALQFPTISQTFSPGLLHHLSNANSPSHLKYLTDISNSMSKTKPVDNPPNLYLLQFSSSQLLKKTNKQKKPTSQQILSMLLSKYIQAENICYLSERSQP